MGVVYVVTLTLSLPPTDGAYGTLPFSDPLVFPLMLMGASMAACIVSPFAVWLLRGVRLRPTITLTFGAAAGTIVIAVLLRHAGLGLMLGPVVTVACMFYSRHRWAIAD